MTLLHWFFAVLYHPARRGNRLRRRGRRSGRLNSILRQGNYNLQRFPQRLHELLKFPRKKYNLLVKVRLVLQHQAGTLHTAMLRSGAVSANSPAIPQYTT